MTENNKKTILYLITQSELGGASKYVYDLARSLKDEFRVVVAYGEQGHGGELARQLREIGVENSAIPGLKREISPLFDLIALVNIIRLIRRINPDIIHLNSSKISVLGAIAGLFSRAKVVYTVHGWVFNEPGRNNDFYRRTEKYTASLKDRIICVSEFDRRAAIKEKIVPENKLITIHNGLEPVKFMNPAEARAKLISLIPPPGDAPDDYEFRINEKDFILGSIGNLYPTKGFEYLVSAVKILIDNGIGIKTMIIGEGGERAELSNWIEQLRLRKYVRLMGRIDNSAELLRAFDIYVCSSVKEGLSYTIMEAMQAGLPIIATRVGGNGELIEHKKEGFLVGHKNAESLAGGIIELMNSHGLIKTISVNAREKAKNEFSLNKMIERTKAVYYSLLPL